MIDEVISKILKHIDKLIRKYKLADRLALVSELQKLGLERHNVSIIELLTLNVAPDKIRNIMLFTETEFNRRLIEIENSFVSYHNKKQPRFPLFK